MSKKLIAVASAAALALTALVGVAPASATVATIDWNKGAAAGAGTAASPYTEAVPYLNSIAVGTNALHIEITNLVAGDTATVSISGTAKVASDVVGASTLIDVRNIGGSSLTKTASSGTLNFYVFDTKAESASTITLTVSETDGGVKSTTTASKVYEAAAGVAHAVTGLTGPATLAASADGEITFKITDVFGNELDTGSNSISATNSAVIDGGAATYSSSRKLWVGKVTAPSNTRPFVITVDGNAGQSDDGPLNAGLGASSVDNQVLVVNNAGVSAQVAALTAQLAESRPKATSVTKKKYNTLARKWNAAFPSQKVALKK